MLQPKQAMPINLPVSYFPEGSTTVFTEIWLHTDLEILNERCKLQQINQNSHNTHYDKK